jgi:tetratricopeptide (TPR) repeat protein
MKTQQRHHLKENELVHGLNVARDYIEPRARPIGMIVGALVLIGVVVAGFLIVRTLSGSAADVALAEAMTALNARVVPPSDPDAADLPQAASLENTGSFATEAAKLAVAIPKLQAVADRYQDDQAGIVARYHLGGALAAMGRNDEAIKAFTDVLNRAPKDSIYSRMSRMGLADTQVRAGQFDAAIKSWKELADDKTADLPTDAILLELARAYAAKGDTAEARKVYTQLLDEHPTSPYSSDAKQGLEGLKG